MKKVLIITIVAGCFGTGVSGQGIKGLFDQKAQYQDEGNSQILLFEELGELLRSANLDQGAALEAWKDTAAVCKREISVAFQEDLDPGPSARPLLSTSCDRVEGEQDSCFEALRVQLETMRSSGLFREGELKSAAGITDSLAREFDQNLASKRLVSASGMLLMNPGERPRLLLAMASQSEQETGKVIRWIHLLRQSLNQRVQAGQEINALKQLYGMAR